MTTYHTYVEHGNVPITQLPRWVATVGQRIRYWRAMGAARRNNEKHETRKQREIMKRLGLL